jgi:hypothetical protein
MTREEAISILEHRLDYWKRISNKEGVGVPIDNDIEALNMAVEALKQPEQKWILCSKRLPKIDELVLVTTKWNDISTAWRIWNDKWFIREGDINATTDDLIAWMELPEPYECKGE